MWLDVAQPGGMPTSFESCEPTTSRIEHSHDGHPDQVDDGQLKTIIVWQARLEHPVRAEEPVCLAVLHIRKYDSDPMNENKMQHVIEQRHLSKSYEGLHKLVAAVQTVKSRQ